MGLLLDFPADDGDKLRLAAIQQCGLLLCLYSGDRDKYEEFLRLGGSGGDIVLYQHNPTAVAPTIAMAVQGDTLLVNVCGTQNKFQWAQHVQGSWGVPFQYAHGIDDPKNVWAHSVMYDVARGVWLDAQTMIGRYQPQRVLICGHSYGAGVGTLVMAFVGHFRLPFPQNTQCLGMGGPRVITKTYAQQNALGPWLRVQHERDFITMMPPEIISGRIITGASVGGLMSRLGGGFLLAKAAGQAGGAAASLPTWQHQGGNWALFRSGRLRHITQAGEVARGAEDFGQNYATLIRDAHFNHVIKRSYYPSLKAGLGDPSAWPPAARTLVEWIDANALDLAEPDDPAVSWLDYFVPREGAVWRANFPGVEPPSAEALARAEGVAVSYALGRPSAGLGEGGGAMPSGTWKLTCYLYWGNKSISTGTHFRGPATWAAAKAKAQRYVTSLSNFLGRDIDTFVNLPAFEGTKGTPIYLYYRLQDVETLRESELFPTDHELSVGYTSDPVWGNTGADFRGTCLAFRLTGLSTKTEAGKGARRSRDRITIPGIPDACVVGGTFNRNVFLNKTSTPPTTTGNQMLSFLRALTKAENGYGFVGLDPSVPNRNVSGWIKDADGRAVATVPGHDLMTGDWVRVSGTRVDYLNDVWRVNLEANGTLTLRESLIHDVQIPSGGKMRRVRRANGTIDYDFYQYQKPPSGTITDDFQIDVVGRRVGRAFDPLASRRRRKKKVKQ